MRYEDASHTGAFQGQGPVANDDLEMVAAGSKSAATGNLITGDGTQSGSAGADSAAGAHITAIAGKSGEDTSFAGGKLSVEGEYGKLSVDAEGNYVYQANKGVENVRDRFTYTLADNQGATDSAALIVEIGKTPVVIKADAQQIVPGPDGVVTLPPGVELSDVHVVGRNLVIDMPDGTQLIIIDGAVFVPQLVVNGVEVPATNVAALLVGQEIQPAAGELPPSSGGNFAVPPPPLDPGVPLGDLIPPTEYNYQPPEPQPPLEIQDTEPEAGVASAILDDDAQAGGIAGGVGDDPGTNFASGNLPGSGGDGSLEWELLASGTLPAGFSFSLQGNGDLWVMQGATHVLTITVNSATGDYTVTQVAAIDHPAGGDENNLDFVINYSVTDDDGDTATGTLTVNVDDDTPTVDVSVASDANVVLLTQDAETDGDPTDTDTDSTTADFGGIFSHSSAFGADGAGTANFSYALSTIGGASGLTHHGDAINLYLIGGVVVGSTAATAGAVNAGNTVFDISVDANTGVATVNQYSQIDHTNTDPSPTGPGYEDHLISLADGAVTLTQTGTVTDGDGDTVTDSASVGIGGNIHFADDGPSIDPTLNEVGGAVVDESEPVDAATIALTAGFTRGDDPDLSGGLAIGKGSTSGPVIDANAVFGADGPANGGGISYDLVVGNTVSGLTTTDGTAINLVELSNGVVVGVVDGTTTVAFAIQIDSATGVVTVEQYLSIFHPDSPSNFDEPVFLDEGSLGVTVTASDFDGDSVTSDAVDITSLIRFEDDGPAVDPTLNAEATVTVDESLPSNTPGIDTGGIAKGDDPDLAGGLAIGQANSGAAIVDAHAVFGADGPADSDSLSYSLDILNADSGLTLTDGTPINLQMVNGVIVGVVNGGDFDGEAAFAIAIDSATGVVTVEQYLSLDHPLNPNPNDPLSFGEDVIGVTVTATDGDGDQVTSDAVDIGGQLTFLDDGPAANDDSDTVNNDTDTAVGNVITGSGTAEGTGNHDVPGADGFGSITGLVSDETDDSDTNSSGGFTVVGAYGTLQMDADGNYTYTRDPASPGNVSESFTYTYVDGDGDPITAVLTININDETPTLPDPDLIRLDDDVIPGKNGNDPDGPGDDNPDGIGNNVVNGQLEGTGGNGTLTYNFTGDDTLPTGFSIGAGSDSDTLIIVQDQNGSPVTVMTIQLDQSDGSFTVTQNNPVWHPADNGGPDDNIENNLNLSIGVEVEDADGDTEPAHITINVDDDTPTINVTAGSDSGVNLTTDDADTIGVATDTASSSANFGGVFGLTQSAGADGTNAAATLLYTLDVTGYAGGPAGVNSGLESHNVDIFLYEIGGKVVGSTSATLAGVNAGNTVFDVGVNGSGVVTLTQYQQIDHDTVDPSPTGSPFADHIVSLTDSLVTLTASASLTDKDGDTVTDSETVNIGANLHFTDDGPDAALSGQGAGTVTLDETRAEGTDTVGGSAPTGDASATIDFSVSFVTGGSVDYGADGAGSVTYALQLTGSNVASGLYALDNTDTETVIDGYGQGGQIVLNQVGNTITGSFNGTNYFTITIDPTTGVVTFTQLNNIWHPTAGSSAAALDESATLNTLAANLIQVVQTVTDFDGDTDTASINIGQGVFIIQDDGPRFGPDIDDTLSILNDANPSNTGDLDIVIGTDSPNGPLVGANPAQTQDDISVSNFTVQVNGVDADNIVLTPGAENATTASYTFTFDYDTGTGGTATAEGTLVFDKSAGTYTVTLTNGPIEGFSLLSTGAADASDFVSYQVPSGGSGSPEVTVAQLDTDFFVQFSGVAEPGSGTGANNLFTTQGTAGSFDPVTTANFNNLELFTQSIATIQVSNAAAGVAGNTIQGGEVLDLNLYSSDPAGTLGGIPTQQSTSMFMTLDGIGGAEDMIVVLKLLDTSTGEYTTRAIIVQNADILTDADAASLVGTAYEGLGAALDNNDGLIVIEANDYQQGNTNLVIVGAQIAGSDEGIAGNGINLNGDVGDSGGSSGTQAFSTDVSDAPFKITSIGFLTTTTEDQTAQIDFDVTIHDADGDTATQHITVDIGDTQSPALLPPAPESFSTLSTESLLAYDSGDQQLQKTAANSNTLTLAAAVAAAGITESVAAAPPSSDQPTENSDLSVQSTQMFDTVAADDGGDDSSSVAGLPETQEADDAAGKSGGHSQGDEHRSAASLDAASDNQSSDQGSEHQAANDDQGPAAASADASPAAQSVAMVSAEALQAAGLDNNAQHGGAVEKIIAEALGHGNGHGAAVDAILDAFHGGNGGGQAIADLASSPAGGVSAWDMASNGGSAGANEMLMKVGAEMLHHDMVQPTHNG